VRCLYAAKCNSYNLLWPTNWYVAYLQFLLDVFIANVNISQIYIVQNHEASSGSGAVMHPDLSVDFVTV